MKSTREIVLLAKQVAQVFIEVKRRQGLESNQPHRASRKNDGSGGTMFLSLEECVLGCGRSLNFIYMVAGGRFERPISGL